MTWAYRATNMLIWKGFGSLFEQSTTHGTQQPGGQDWFSQMRIRWSARLPLIFSLFLKHFDSGPLRSTASVGFATPCSRCRPFCTSSPTCLSSPIVSVFEQEESRFHALHQMEQLLRSTVAGRGFDDVLVYVRRVPSLLRAA